MYLACTRKRGGEERKGGTTKTDALQTHLYSHHTLYE